jgi:menaquinone-specific isochorismate synthase
LRGASRPEELVARSRALPGPENLIGMGSGLDRVLWMNEELGLAGEGVALRLDFAGAEDAGAVSEALATIDTDDEVLEPGSGPVAFSALPFDLRHGGELVVPSRIVGRRGGRWWETVIERRDGATPAVPPLPDSPGASPDEFSLSPSMPHEEWQRVIAEAVERIGNGELDKVVLARRVDVVANRPFVLNEVIGRLVALYPTCMVFHLGGFIGASPELLVRREGAEIASHPLAGTVARSGDEAADDALVAGLMASAKERWEHRVVIDHLVEVLGPLCDRLELPETPVVLGLRNVSHLATPIHGQLSRRRDRIPTALELVAALHPTAAVGGHPAADAVAYLEKVEGFERGPYAGPVGWVDGRGDGAWALGIRSAQVEGNRASMYAGNGIVAGSDPAAELAETQLKLQALLAALVRP